MKLVSRKKFLLSGISLISLPAFLSIKKEISLKLSFSTLGCPDWSFDKIIDFARANQYSGIEVRGILRQMDLPLVPEFLSTDAISTTMKKMNDHGLKFVDLGSSCALHFQKGDERTKNLNEGKRFIDLAAKLNCPYIRVFPNQIPKDRDREETLTLIIEGLKELGTYASNSNVTVLLESHGELIYKKDLLYVMEGAANPHVGLVWDVCNMWIVTKEPPEEVYTTLKSYIRHTHIKDLKIENGKEEYVLLGTGIVPIFAAIDLLYKNNYPGYYSFEWEKLWHPEITEPQIALADYPLAIKKHFLQV
ncbi:MAG TPA: sugar phosphate isomerase/epimerase family protein [Puia sp.]|nr:sugar phosphate isomerase/epimerase family protein [Puia sp.]